MWNEFAPTPYREMLLDDKSVTWSDSNIPLEKRGIQAEWLVHFVWSIMAPMRRSLDEYWRIRNSLQEGQLHWEVPDSIEPPEPRREPSEPIVVEPQKLTTRQVVQHFIVPLTQSIRAPLYALAPLEVRGEPSIFISHAWDAPIFQGAHGFGTLDVLNGSRAFVWIDMVCYNQHTFEAVATDMESVIGSVGRVAFAMTLTPLFDRIWCLWELICAARLAHARLDFPIPSSWHTEMMLLASTSVESFTSVAHAKAAIPADYHQVLAAIVKHFGSVERADEYIRSAMHSSLGYLLPGHQ